VVVNKEKATMTPRILIILGHPNLESFNAALAKAYEDGARDEGAEVEFLALADLLFDPVLRPRGPQSGAAARPRQPFETDLERAKRAIERADHVVFVFPVWWGGLPALLKGFVDRVFLPGWAYRAVPGARPEKLLTGRTARVVMTMDAPGWYDGLAYKHSAKRAIVNATLRYCGFNRVRTTAYHKIGARSTVKLRAMLDKTRALGARDARHSQRTSPARRRPVGRPLAEGRCGSNP
jgi:NAD(P)H dehydrogenase (quinone)